MGILSDRDEVFHEATVGTYSGPAIYEQDDEPDGAVPGDLWLDTDDDGQSGTSGYAVGTDYIYVESDYNDTQTLPNNINVDEVTLTFAEPYDQGGQFQIVDQTLDVGTVRWLDGAVIFDVASGPAALTRIAVTVLAHETPTQVAAGSALTIYVSDQILSGQAPYLWIPFPTFEMPEGHRYLSSRIRAIGAAVDIDAFGYYAVGHA